ncbi:glutamate racemase [Bacillus songklensis]|uniref:Glutamate racemase n=1 Tax=Bacillus songklensis TaxID=1069116 RepID=A0ABV8AZ47_9BACI
MKEMYNSIQEPVIGVLDSGVGGLTVAREIMHQLPKESIYYIGDNQRCPYGPRKREEVKKFTYELVEFLMQFPLKAIVIACNTASAAALDSLQKELSIPVIGVIHPGARAAIKVTNHQKVGVIGTIGTIQSNMYAQALQELHPYIKVYSLACPTLATVVEHHLDDEIYVKQQVEQALKPFHNKDIDTLILGCTHYPHLETYIREVIGENVSIISSAEETAVELSAILQHQGSLSQLISPPFHRYFTTGPINTFEHIAEKWLGHAISAEYVNLKENYDILRSIGI